MYICYFSGSTVTHRKKQSLLVENVPLHTAQIELWGIFSLRSGMQPEDWSETDTLALIFSIRRDRLFWTLPFLHSITAPPGCRKDYLQLTSLSLCPPTLGISLLDGHVLLLLLLLLRCNTQCVQTVQLDLGLCATAVSLPLFGRRRQQHQHSPSHWFGSFYSSWLDWAPWAVIWKHWPLQRHWRTEQGTHSIPICLHPTWTTQRGLSHTCSSPCLCVFYTSNHVLSPGRLREWSYSMRITLIRRLCLCVT